MASLKFTIKGVEFQFEGTEQEVLRFINQFFGASMSLPEHAPIAFEKTNAEETTRKVDKPKAIELPLPSDNELINYITSKPQFSHDILEIQDHFFGRRFSSRGADQRMYHRIARKLRSVRALIEKQWDGNFKQVPSEQRNLKRFTFEKNTMFAQIPQ